MNALGIALAWCAVQVTVVAAVAGLVSLATRRLAPSTRALAMQTSLVVCIALSALAMAPWPRWWNAESLASNPIAEKTNSEQLVAPGQSAVDGGAGSNVNSAGGVPAAGLSFDWREFANSFWNVSQQSRPATETTSAPRSTNWPAILAYVLLAGAALALLRVALGLRAVNVYRRVSIPVTDREILEQVDVVCAELNCHRKIEVRESAELATPATTGWLRPVIFLPVEWREWSEQQSLAVLAHEISHIGRNDFLTSMCARVGVALHFYHPLVHWLMRQLTLEQELAADADAARVTGGQRAYLTILAEMALAQSNRKVAWAARTFLPTRGTFLRRIEMLRDSKQLSRSASPGLRLAAVGVLLAAGLLAAGFRAPGSSSGDALATEPPTSDKLLALADDATNSATPAAAPEWELSYIPADTASVVAVCPASILAQSEWKALAPVLNEFFGSNKLLDMPISDVEQVVVSIDAGTDARRDSFGTFMIRTKQPGEFKTVLRDFGHSRPFVEKQADGKTYFVCEESQSKEAYFRPDDRTLVCGIEATIAEMRRRGSKKLSQLVAGANWDRVKNSPVAVIVDGNWLKGFKGFSPVEAGIIAPILEESNSLAASFEFGKGLKLSIFADCRNADGAEKVKATGNAVLILGRNALAGLESAASQAPAEVQGKLALIAPLKSLANSAKVEQQQNVVSVKAEVDGSGELVAQVTQQILQAGTSARKAAQRTTSQNNLKRIGLAMHSYHDVHGHLPPAAVLGPDGKTTHSWRVALLPYLERKDLFEQYNPNQPWDSEDNKRVLAQMPDVFRHPNDESKEPHSSYYVLDGKGSVFDGIAWSRIRDITDGTSNTLMVVEAKRDIPWTKPEDLPYDPAKELPAFGGFSPDGFGILLCDGSARFASAKIPEETLKLLIERGDGRVVGEIGDGPNRPPVEKAPASRTP